MGDPVLPTCPEPCVPLGGGVAKASVLPPTCAKRRFGRLLDLSRGGDQLSRLYG